MNEYEKQAADFLSAHGLKFRAVYLETIEDREMSLHLRSNGYEWNAAMRAKYRCTISGHGRGRVSFVFTTSINDTENGIEPNAYDLLACIQKYDCGDFDNFVSEFGYEITSLDTYRQAHKTWLAVKNEWRKVARFFTPEEIEQLQEIN